MTPLIPPAPRVNFVDSEGKITRPWSDWLLRALYARVGGAEAPSITELNDEIEALQAESQSVAASFRAPIAPAVNPEPALSRSDKSTIASLAQRVKDLEDQVSQISKWRTDANRLQELINIVEATRWR